VTNKVRSVHSSVANRFPQEGEGNSPRGRLLRAIFQLLRVPNLFTAIADVLSGYFIGVGSLNQISWELAGFLGFGAVCFYGGGVVLNDVVDLPQDRLCRPERPLPCGSISLKVATALGFGLLLLGWITAGAVSLIVANPWPWVIANMLGICILGYNFWAKNTFLGPMVMGLCRVLNLSQGILTGLVISARWFQWAHVWGAISLGLYVAGITVVARGEAQGPKRKGLLLGLAIILSAVAILAALPVFIYRSRVEGNWTWTPWLFLIGLPSVILGLRFGQALIAPSPVLVQRAVKQAILWIIVWDATLCFAWVGGIPALVILVLLIPAGFLSLWVNPT